VIAGPLAALGALVAAAGPFDGTQRLDAATGVVVSSSRVVGLAGAYAAVAEGLDGVRSNPAAVAQRDRHLERGWDWDFVLAWLAPQAGDLARQDVANSGHTDGRLSGFTNLQLGLGGQWGRLGLALVGSSWVLSSPRADGSTLLVGTSDVALYAGWSLWDEQLVVGTGVAAVRGTVQRTAPGVGAQTRQYDGGLLRGGALWRPRGLPLRLGLTVDPGSSARAKEDPGLPVATPTSFSFPALLSLGGAVWLGPNAALLNEPSPAARRQLDLAPGRLEGEGEPVLLSAQLDLVGRSPGAVSLDALFDQGTGASDPPSGSRRTLAARLGAEWEALPRRVAIRGGSYLEPSRTGAPLRPHATFGADVRIHLRWDFRVGLAGDLASRYQNLSLSLGLWKDNGPRAPPAAAPEPGPGG
jgi:hypothetical protein